MHDNCESMIHFVLEDVTQNGGRSLQKILRRSGISFVEITRDQIPILRVVMWRRQNTYAVNNWSFRR